MMVPIMDAVRTLNDYGMEVVSGIILGLDTDTPETGKHLLEFIEQSQDPAADHQPPAGAAEDAAVGSSGAGRAPDRGRRARDSNVKFRLPYEHVVTSWRNCMKNAYRPDKLYERYQHQVEHTFPNRLQLRAGERAILLARRPPRTEDARRGSSGGSALSATTSACSGSSRCRAWSAATSRALIATALISHHLIIFSREASGGLQNCVELFDAAARGGECCQIVAFRFQVQDAEIYAIFDARQARSRAAQAELSAGAWRENVLELGDSAEPVRAGRPSPRGFGLLEADFQCLIRRRKRRAARKRPARCQALRSASSGWVWSRCGRRSRRWSSCCCFASAPSSVSSASRSMTR